MDLYIDEKVIETEMNRLATESVETAFSAYGIQDAIKKEVADKIVGRVLTQAIDCAVDRVDVEALTQELAKQLGRTMVAATISVLREQTVRTLFSLQGGHDYDDDNHAHKDKIRAELKAQGKE